MAGRIRIRGEMVSWSEVEEGALFPGRRGCRCHCYSAGAGRGGIRLFATLRPGATATAETIRSHCRIVMAKFLVSTGVTILDEMPRTVTGKPEKDRLATYSL